MKGKRVLLAGATGYLGSFLARELVKQGYEVTVVVRNLEKWNAMGIPVHKVFRGEVTRPESLQGICEEIDQVISTVGITRQKDGLTYEEVDFQANLNLLEEAQRSGVEKFVYVSVLGGEKMRQLAICDAKERFVDALAGSGMDYVIIRPNGFFSDMLEFLQMAKRGRVWLFKKGKPRVNPIHGADLAEFVLAKLSTSRAQWEVGGPEVLSQNEIAELAFSALGKPVKVGYVPEFVRKFVLWFGKSFLPGKVFGPVEFFLTGLAEDSVGAVFGVKTLGAFFVGEVEEG